MSFSPSRFSISYPAHELLSAKSTEWIRYSLGQNNGYISYGLLADASLSLREKLINSEFRNFVLNHTQSEFPLLDVGCGPQEIPFYLIGIENELIGLDPFPSKFRGNFIQGTAEYIPLTEQSVGTIVCATSIDHFMHLERCINEFERILIRGGDLIIWDHAPQKAGDLFRVRLRIFYSRVTNFFRIFFQKGNYQIYDNGVVLTVPRGYVDPFHTPNSRKSSWHRSLSTILVSSGFIQVIPANVYGFSYWKKR